MRIQIGKGGLEGFEIPDSIVWQNLCDPYSLSPYFFTFVSPHRASSNHFSLLAFSSRSTTSKLGTPEIRFPLDERRLSSPL